MGATGSLAQEKSAWCIDPKVLWVIMWLGCSVWAGGCTPNASTQHRAQRAAQPKQLPPPPNAAPLNVRSARFELILGQADDEPVKVSTQFSLSWPHASTREGYLELLIPQGVTPPARVEGGCELHAPPSTSSEARLAQVRCLRATGEGERVVKLTYQRALSDLSSYVSLEEGERRYALLALSPQEWPELFLGADPKRVITRYVSVIAHHPVSQEVSQEPPQGDELTPPHALARLGREAPAPISLEESAQPGYEWSWRREGPLTEPLIITRGAWEMPLEAEVAGRRLSLLTPAGSAQHRVQGAPFAQQQLSLISDELKRIQALYAPPSQESSSASQEALKVSAQEHLWCLTLPLSPSSSRLKLAEWGVVTLPEAWFYRALKGPQAQSPSERSQALRALLRSDMLKAGAQGVWSEGVALWLARRVSLSAAQLPLEYTQREALENTLSLNPHLELSQANTPERAAQLIEMVNHWLTLRHRSSKKEGLGRLNDQLLLEAAFTGDEAVVKTLSAQAPAFQTTLTPLLERAEAPEVRVAWAWSEATKELSLSLSTEGDLLPPLCMKLGVEGSEPYTLCMKPSRPVGGASSEHKVALPKEPLWLHPNHSQVGFYRWVISEEAFLKLLKASNLSPLEWGALPEIASQLMGAGRLSASAYLSSVDALTLQALTPSSLALLMSYLNRAVHEFASPQNSAQSQDPVRN